MIDGSVIAASSFQRKETKFPQRFVLDLFWIWFFFGVISTAIKQGRREWIIPDLLTLNHSSFFFLGMKDFFLFFKESMLDSSTLNWKFWLHPQSERKKTFHFQIPNDWRNKKTESIALMTNTKRKKESAYTHPKPPKNARLVIFICLKRKRKQGDMICWPRRYRNAAIFSQ